MVVDFGNILEEMKKKNFEICAIGNTICLLKENKVYQIENYYHGSYLDKFIKNSSIINFTEVKNTKDIYIKWYMGIDEMKNFIENVIKI